MSQLKKMQCFSLLIMPHLSGTYCVFKMRKRDRSGKDVRQVRVVKDRHGNVLTKENGVGASWTEYFGELLNE